MPSPETYGAVEYARGIHSEAWNSNKDLYTRAQIVLTLDGIVIGAVAAGLAAQADDLRKTVAIFGAETWAVLAIAGAALVASVVCSTLALLSRHLEGAEGDAASSTPETVWYYARVAELVRERGRTRFVEDRLHADASLETRTRLEQVATMAKIMVDRAQWLNRAFVSTALAFVAFAAASADYLIRLAW